MSNIISCFSDIADQLRVDSKTGQGFVSWSALARLCGVKSHGNFGRGLAGRAGFFSLKIDQHLTECGFNPGDFDYSNGVPDIIAAEVIAYYAEEVGNPIAKQSSRGFRAIGIRQAIHIATGYKPPVVQQLTSEQIVNMLILPEAKEWSLRFPPEYYAQLERLTGLTAGKHGRPPLWGKLTREWVYDYLPAGVYERLCDLRDNHSKRPRLHQFLVEETGIELLRDHYNALMVLMQAADSMFEVSKLLRTRKDVTTRILEARQFTNALSQASS